MNNEKFNKELIDVLNKLNNNLESLGDLYDIKNSLSFLNEQIGWINTSLDGIKEVIKDK